MHDRNLYRSGRWGLISIAVEIVGCAIGDNLTGSRLGWLAARWIIFAFALLPWWLFSCSAVKAAKSMRWYVAIAAVARVLECVAKMNGQSGMVVIMVLEGVVQVTFLVALLSVALKNTGPIRKVMWLFVVTTVVGLLGQACVLAMAMAHLDTPGRMTIGFGSVVSGCVSIVRAGLIAGYLYLMYDAGSAADGSSNGKRKVALHWRVFFACLPLIILFPQHFSLSALIFLTAPAGLFGLFFTEATLNKFGLVLLAVGWLAYGGLLTAIVRAKTRRMIGMLLGLFVVFLLMNVGGCIRMLPNFGIVR